MTRQEVYDKILKENPNFKSEIERFEYSFTKCTEYKFAVLYEYLQYGEYYEDIDFFNDFVEMYKFIEFFIKSSDKNPIIYNLNNGKKMNVTLVITEE